jgi:hypothetical protein
MDKKGQVSVLIIIGIVIFIIIGIGLFYFFRMDFDRIDSEDYDNTKLTDRYKVITDYIESCMSNVAVDGILLLGQGGGRIYFDEESEFGSYTESFNKGFTKLYPNTNQNVNYFSYLKGKRPCFYCKDPYTCQCNFETNLNDGLDLIKSDLVKYMKENSYECIAGIKQFEDQGYEIVNLSNMEYNVILYDESVDVFLDYKLGINFNNEYKEIEKYFVNVDIPLKLAYDYASYLTIYLVETQRAENILKNLIQYYSSLDSESLPPFYDITESFNYVIWSKLRVTKLLKNLLNSYFGLMQVKGSLNYEKFEDGIYEYFNMNPFGNNSVDFDVSFNYYGSDFYFDIFPNDGEILKPKIIPKDVPGGLLPPNQINTYNFFYDVSFPLIGTIVFHEQTDVDDFIFNFAYQVNFIKNSNLIEINNDFGPTDLEVNASFGLNEDYVANVGDDDFCFDISNSDARDKCYAEVEKNANDVDVLVNDWINDVDLESEKSLFCNQNQFLSEPFTIVVEDKISDETLKDVTVTYACGNYNSCHLGTTKPDDANDKNVFYGNSPICKNGMLILQKDGYYVSKIPFSTDDVNSRYNVVKMIREYPINISLDIFQLGKNNKEYVLDNISNVSNFISILTFTKVKVRDYDSDYVKVLMFEDLDSVQKIDLIPGSYEINGVLIDENDIVIPKKCKKVKDNLILDDVYIPDDDIVLKSLPYGGVVYSKDTRLFRASVDDLENNDNLEIKLFRYLNPRCFDSLKQLERTDYYTELLGDRIYPVWS